MTNKSKIIAGLDLGSTKIGTVVAQIQVDPVSNETLVNVIGVSSTESRGIRKGQIVDIEESVEAIVECVEGAERMAGYNLDSAFIALGGASISGLNSRGVVAVSNSEGEITQEDVERVVEAASAISLPSSREVIHVVPREYIVDGESGVKDPIGMSGVRLEVETHIISASSAALKNLKKAVNEVGITVNEVVFSGLASANAVLTETEKELGAVLIDMGGGTTSVATYIDGGPSFSYVIPIGARNVTNDLAIGLRVSLESAEKIKLALSELDKKSKRIKEERGDEFDLQALGITEARKVSRKTLTEGIIRPRLNEIFSMVRLSLEKEGLASRVPSGAILTGGGAETVGVVDSARRMLSLPVRVGVPKGISGLIDDVVNPSFATPIGLVIYGASREPQETPKWRFPLFSKGIFGKMLQTVKDLLP